jgi:hypothetical protein
LRGVLGYDGAVLWGIKRLLAPVADVTVLVSVLPHDNAPAVPPADALAVAYGRHGLNLVEARAATPVEVAASHSSWAKRLRAGPERPVTLLRARAPEGRPLEREAPAVGTAESAQNRLIRSGRDG